MPRRPRGRPRGRRVASAVRVPLGRPVVSPRERKPLAVRRGRECYPGPGPQQRGGAGVVRQSLELGHLGGGTGRGPRLGELGQARVPRPAEQIGLWDVKQLPGVPRKLGRGDQHETKALGVPPKHGHGCRSQVEFARGRQASALGVAGVGGVGQPQTPGVCVAPVRAGQPQTVQKPRVDLLRPVRVMAPGNAHQDPHHHPQTGAHGRPSRLPVRR